LCDYADTDTGTDTDTNTNTEVALLGKRRAPRTSEGVELVEWLMGLSASTGVACLAAGRLKKKK